MLRYINMRMGANTLPTVIVVAMLMTLAVLVVLGAWETEGLLFARTNFRKACTADIRSGFSLYAAYPGIMDGRDSVSIRLYDSSEASIVTVERKPWGLYEVVSVTAEAGGMYRTGILGIAKQGSDSLTFCYPDTGSSVTMAGRSNIQGKMEIPRNGIIYGQMRSVFFSGEKPDIKNIGVSEKELPAPSGFAKAQIEELFALLSHEHPSPETDSISAPFYRNDPVVIRAYGEELADCTLEGNIILLAEKLLIDVSANLRDILIIGRDITVAAGFRGSAQIFATDTLRMQGPSFMEYPSGIYSNRYIELGDNAIVNGYAIVKAEDQSDIMKAHYRQSRMAKVRGMLYAEGNTQLQGIVSGSAYVSKLVYYSPQGYYKDMLYDASLLRNEEMAMPLWVGTDRKRDLIKWVF